MKDVASAAWRARISRGIAWNGLYHLFQIAVTFSAMLVLVRIVPPVEYGRAAAVVGWLAVLNAFNCGQFMAQALQLSDEAEPDWSLHWWAGLYVQGTLSVVCHVVAAGCWVFPAYRPIAPLLHLAGLGLILDGPNRLGGIMLRRAMDFRRLRIVEGIGMLVSVAGTLVVAGLGGGAYAIVLGGNVLSALPFTFDLLLVRRWRPRQCWWRTPDWTLYRSALQFGFQRTGSALLHAARGWLEAVVLAPLLGFDMLGFWNRAQAIYGTTVRRLESAVTEAVYPVLPRYAADERRYPEHATLFAQALFLVAIVGGLFIGLEGPTLSRLLYGDKWVAADPLIWPATLAGIALTMFSGCWSVLLAANRLRICLALDTLIGGVAIAMAAIVVMGGDMIRYAWAITAGYLVAATIAAFAATPLVTPRWARVAILPPLVSAPIAAVVILGARPFLQEVPAAARLAMTGSLYAVVVLLVLRSLFPQTLAGLLGWMPVGARLGHYLTRVAVPRG